MQLVFLKIIHLPPVLLLKKVEILALIQRIEEPQFAFFVVGNLGMKAIDGPKNCLPDFLHIDVVFD